MIKSVEADTGSFAVTMTNKVTKAVVTNVIAERQIRGPIRFSERFLVPTVRTHLLPTV